MFIVFEGIDGCGKSTQIRLLADFLQKQGRQVAAFKEPGSTPLGECIRSLVLDPMDGEMEPLTELFLFMAARSHLVRRKILPALQKKKGGAVRSFLVVLGGLPGRRRQGGNRA